MISLFLLKKQSYYSTIFAVQRYNFFWNIQFFLSKSSSKSYSYQHDFNPRSVNLGVVHLYKAVCVVIVCGEAVFSDAALGYGLNLYARKRTHGCDDFAISISNLVLVLVDDKAIPCFPAFVAPLAADGKSPFPSLPFCDGVLDIRKGLSSRILNRQDLLGCIHRFRSFSTMPDMDIGNFDLWPSKRK